MQKKRLLAFVLCIVLILTLCSCGRKAKVKEELIGFYEGYGEFVRSFGFYEDGTYDEVYYSLFTSDVTEGTWKVKRDRIILTEYDGSTNFFTYEYNKSSGELTLYYNDSDTPYYKHKDW